MPPALVHFSYIYLFIYLFIYLLGRLSCVGPGSTECDPATLPYSWDYICVPSFQAYCLRWGLANIFPGLVSNLNPSDLCLLRS
jgi:hypothetical protein